VQAQKGSGWMLIKALHDHQSKEDDRWDPAQQWFEKYDHPLGKNLKNTLKRSHGGMDWFVFNAFVESVKQKKTNTYDVYDSMTMSVIAPLLQNQ